MGDVDLEDRVRVLEERIKAQEQRQNAEVKRIQEEVSRLQKQTNDLEMSCSAADDSVGSVSKTDWFMRHVEWKIADFSAKTKDLTKGNSIWSPKFRAAGLDGLQLEFFPKGREKTTYDGFCSLFLWCPSGTKMKYQLFVGKFYRAPDEDEYSGRIGHGHSNFCPVAPEIVDDTVTVGAKFIDIRQPPDLNFQNVRLIHTPLEKMVMREVEITQNAAVTKVVWTIEKIRDRAAQLPRGASMWSRLFTAAGIPDILFEFYPNGSTNTTKDGHCAFYLRCPEGVSVIVTLFVGRVKKGPIKTVFDSLTGKGLPDFCLLAEQINEEKDSLEVGIEVQNQVSKTMKLTS